jgi:hypothetical protein
MSYGTNWFIQEYLGRIQHAELIEARTRGLAPHGDDEIAPPQKRGTAGRPRRPARALPSRPRRHRAARWEWRKWRAMVRTLRDLVHRRRKNILVGGVYLLQRRR